MLVVAPILLSALHSGSQQGLAASPATAELVLLRASGESERRPVAGFETADPREHGAHLVLVEGLDPAPPAASDESRAEIELHGGDRLYGRLRGGRAELIDVQVAGGVHIGLALDEIASLVFPERIPVLGAALPSAPEEGDRLYRRAGDGLDVIDGGIEEFTSDGVRIHGERVGSKTVAWADVAALFVERLGDGVPDLPRDRGVAVAVDLTDGGRLRGGLTRLSAAGCAIETVNGDAILIPLEAVALVLVDDGEVAFLSALVPADAPPSLPFGDDLGMSWPHRVDRSVGGGPLAAGGRTFSRGLGVHAPSRIVWRLDGSYAHLRAFVAVDDQVLRLPARGSVVFRVLVDGETRFESREMHAGDPLTATGAIDLAGARELAFVVDPSDGSIVADRADWLMPILWR